MKKVATLEVWQVEHPWEDRQPSRLQFMQAKDGEVRDSFYQLLINPSVDKTMPYGDDTRAVIAHELGHFVGLLTKTPEHAKLPNVSRISPVENEAWDIANQMGLNLDGRTEASSKISYRGK